MTYKYPISKTNAKVLSEAKCSTPGPEALNIFRLFWSFRSSDVKSFKPIDHESSTGGSDLVGERERRDTHTHTRANFGIVRLGYQHAFMQLPKAKKHPKTVHPKTPGLNDRRNLHPRQRTSHTC